MQRFGTPHPAHAGHVSGAFTSLLRITFDSMPLGDYPAGETLTPGSPWIHSVQSYDNGFKIWYDEHFACLGQHLYTTQCGANFKATYADATVYFHKPAGSNGARVGFFGANGGHKFHVVANSAGGSNLLAFQFSALPNQAEAPRKDFAPGEKIDGISVHLPPGGYIAYFEVAE